MKKTILLFIGCAIAMVGQSQTFSDDFESYNVGDYVGAQSSNWTTWSGSTGGAEDAQVVNDNFNSDSNSIYFYSASTTGGPQDVVLPFGGAYTSGIFKYEMMMYITSGTDAYFNFQAESTIGQVWAADFYGENGGFVLGNTNGSLLSGTYPEGQWFRLSFDINLTNNEWEMLIDSVSAGTFANTINKIASIDLFPLVQSNSESEFWVDDVYYDYNASTLPTLNGLVSAVNLPGIAGQSKIPTATVRNAGQNNISSFDIEVTYDGNTQNKSITGITLASLTDYIVTFDNEFTIVPGANNLVATISNVNGGSDDDATDDSKTVVIDPIVPAPNKKVLVEEATGTWCQWCPRGAVWMERMQEEYPDYFVGVAVHNNDPMEDSIHDAGYALLSTLGYPSVLVDRSANIDPAAMEPDFQTRVAMAPAGVFDLSAEMITETKALITAKVGLTQAVSSTWKVGAILVENDVTGTESGYAQSNAYSGGGAGELSGAGHDWHNEPSSVPAADMEYDHVSRGIFPSFFGLVNSFPSITAAGDSFTFEFEADIESSWNLENMHAIAFLADNTGQVDNVEEAEIDPFEPDGIADNSEALTLNVYPNPTSGMLLVLANTTSADNSVVVRDLAGRIVYTNLNIAGNTVREEIDMTSWTSGVYLLELQSGDDSKMMKVIKQ